MLDAGQAIQHAPDQAGVAATEPTPRRFDADGDPIRPGPVESTSTGEVREQHQAPSGVAATERHAYQGSQGGETCCPLDQEARIVASSTPRLAEMIEHESAESGAGRVLEDLAEDHGGELAKAFVRDVADAVATVAPAGGEAREDAVPALEEPAATATVGPDGARLLTGEGGWREAMAGTSGSSNGAGERRHTADTAASPESGKPTSFERPDRELDRVKAASPEALYVGVADGAKEDRPYPETATKGQVVAFDHATRSVGQAAGPLSADDGAGQRRWGDSRGRRPEPGPGAAGAVLADIEAWGVASGGRRLAAAVDSTPTYFGDPIGGGRMDDPESVAASTPIGSGVTEAACEVVVERRRRGPGMRGEERGAAAEPGVRCLADTAGRRSRSRGRIDRRGFAVAA